MRRAALALLVLALIGGAAAWFWPRAHVAGALLVSPNPIDFGDVPWMETARRTVEIRNVSDRDVILKDPHFDCSCFSLSRPPQVLHLTPGKSTTVEILLYTPKTTAGRFHKTFTLESNDPLVPKLDVPVLGTITNFRTVVPRQLSYGTVDPQGPPVEKTVEVRGGSGYACVCTAARSSNPRIAVEVREAKGGSDVVVRTVKGAEKGTLEAQIELTLEVTGPDGAKKTYQDVVWVHGAVL